VSAMFPMMQFSWAPWRALSSEHLAMVRKASELHDKMSDEIIALVRSSEQSGEPIIRSLEYSYPGNGYEHIADEFLLGSNILVAPVVTPNTYERKVVFPYGNWSDESGRIFEGPCEAILPAPLDELLWFRKMK